MDPLVAELNQLREQAKQEGLTAGLEEARRMAEDEFRGRLQSSQASLERLAVLERTLTEAYRTQVLELTIGMAKSVVQRELADHGAARELVERAVAAFEEVGRIDAVVSAAEGEMMEAWAAERRAAGLDIRVHVDNNLEAGDVQIRSDAGSLESRLQDRFDRACEMIRGTTPASATTEDHE
jgi:flagellar biosynthesis/type III secretory pathway protein FliH